MERFFNSSVLSNLYENKREEFEKKLSKKCKDKGKGELFSVTETKIIEFLKKHIKKKEDIKQVEQLLNELELAWTGQLLYWEENYYKLGVIDGFKLKNELKGECENAE